MNKDNERFQRLMTFAKNHRPSGGFSNLYVISKLVNGVPTGEEAYGMNVMTNYGFQRFFGDNDKPSFPTRMYIGKGTLSDIDFKQTQTLIDPITDTPANVIGSALDKANYDYYHYPMWYKAPDNLSEESGLISLMCKYLTCKFPDQTSGGIQFIANISEYGIGEDINNLWTHSWLYDLQGVKTIFTKQPNEELLIEVFFVLTYKESLITDGWTNGRYCAMTTMQLFLRRRMSYDLDPDVSSTNRANDNIAYTYHRNNNLVRRDTTIPTIDIDTLTSTAQIHSNCNNFNIDRNSTFSYMDGFVHLYPGYICVEQQLQPTDDLEPISVIAKPLWDKSDRASGNNSGGSDIGESSVCELFGRINESNTAFTNINVTGLYLYNFNSGQYDNPSAYTNDPNHQYTETPLQISCAIPIYFTSTVDGNIVESWLHVNPYPSDPILRFDNGNVDIYATDTYWDRNSWGFISNPAIEVPSGLRTKRFYITLNNNVSLNPVRQSQQFKMIAETDPHNLQNVLVRRELNLNDMQRNGQYASCDNYEYGYFVKDAYVYMPEKSIKYTIKELSSGNELSSGRDNNTHLCFKNTIVSIGNESGSGTAKYYWTNVSDSNAITTNTYSFYATDEYEGFSSGVTKILDATYKTETTSGVIGFQSLQTDEFVFMYIEYESDNISTGTVGHLKRRFKRTSRMGCCIIDSTENRIAYYDNSNNESKIIVEEYNIATNTWAQIQQYNFPSSNSEPILMFGLRNYLWVTDGSTYMLLYDITSSSDPQSCPTSMPVITDRSKSYWVEMTAVDEMILLYPYTGTSTAYPNTSNGYYILYSNPGTVVQLPYVESSTSRPRLFMRLRKIRNNTLALVIGHTVSSSSNIGSFRAIADIGKYINGQGIDISKDAAIKDIKNEENNRDGIYCYGNNYVIYEYGTNIATTGSRYTNIIPIEYAMSHLYTGTTRTISAINDVRNVSGKSWMNEVTNNKPSNYGESGKPPGILN